MNLHVYFIIWRKVRTEKSRIAFRPYGFNSFLLFVRRRKFRRQDVIDEINDGKNEYAQSEEVGRISEILAYESQRVFTAAGCNGEDDNHSDNNAHERFADNKSRGEEYASLMASVYIFLYVFGVTLLSAITQVLVNEIADNGTDDQGNFQGRRQVNAHADSQGRESERFGALTQKHVDNNCNDAYADTEEDEVPV